MSKRQEPSAAQFRADRPVEQEAVRTTIVGGRPPGSGQRLGEIPRGIEILVKKAAVDPEFKAVLLAERAEAADRIGLKLDPAEVMMLRAVPDGQLETIIARTSVPDRHRRVFLGKVAAAMLAALGITAGSCLPVKGIRPDDPKENDPAKEAASSNVERPNRVEPSQGDRPEPPPERIPVTDGIRPDEPVSFGIRPKEVPTTKGIRPDKIPAPTGSRPDHPPPTEERPRP